MNVSHGTCSYICMYINVSHGTCRYIYMYINVSHRTCSYICMYMNMSRGTCSYICMYMNMSHGTGSYICVYMNAVANSVLLNLYLRLDIHNKVFKTKHEVYIASGSAPAPQRKILDAHVCYTGNLPYFGRTVFMLST